MAELWADPDKLRSVSPQFEQHGEEVNTALEALKAGLQHEGKCWGSDQPGKQFESTYHLQGQGSVDETLGRLARLVTTLKETGDKITATANGLQNQDQANAEKIAQQSKNV